MECCLRKLFLPQSFFKRGPLKETFEMKFYGRHSMSTKYPYYLHRLLLYHKLAKLMSSPYGECWTYVPKYVSVYVCVVVLASYTLVGPTFLLKLHHTVAMAAA